MNLTEIETPALDRFEGYLKAVSDFIRTGELKWYFEAKLFEYEEAVSDVKQLIKAAYPTSDPEKAQVDECSIDDVLETLRHELGRSLTEIESLKFLTPLTNINSEMWRYVRECIVFEESRIYEYFSTEKDGLLNGILGDFAFIIHDENKYRCLIVSGATCD